MRRTKKDAVISWTSSLRSRVNARAAVRKKKRCICGSTTAAIGRHKMHCLIKDFAFPSKYSSGRVREELTGHLFCCMMRRRACMMPGAVFMSWDS